MEAKSEGDECRWTYEVSKVLEDKRKGTSVVGCSVNSSGDACFSSFLMAAWMAFFLFYFMFWKEKFRGPSKADC
jgi:hypothetical protein